MVDAKSRLQNIDNRDGHDDQYPKKRKSFKKKYRTLEEVVVVLEGNVVTVKTRTAEDPRVARVVLYKNEVV